MAKTKKNKNKVPLKKSEKSYHRIMEPDDWSDPSNRKVLGEFHKNSDDIPAGQDQSPILEKKSAEVPGPSLQRIINLSNVELAAYAFSRALFPKGVQVPIYVKGMVDMDVAIKDTNVIINTNDVSFEPPPLQLWHLFFTYKGKPVIEYGQGVKNMIKIHHYRAIVFLLAMWVAGRKRRKLKNKSQKLNT